MMKKIALAASSVIVASAFTASMASAQVAPGNYTLETPGAQFLAVEQSQALACEAELNLTLDTVSSVSVTSGDQGIDTDCAWSKRAPPPEIAAGSLLVRRHARPVALPQRMRRP